MLDVQVRMLYPGGAYRWTRARCVPVRDAQGNIVRYVTFQIDVDDLKRAEDLLAAEVKLLAEGGARRATGSGSGRTSAASVEELCHGCFCNILLVALRQPRTSSVGAGRRLAGHCSRNLLDRSAIDRRRAKSTPIPWRSSREGSDHRGGFGQRLKMGWVGVAGDDEDSWIRLACWSMPIMSGSGEASGILAVYRREPVRSQRRNSWISSTGLQRLRVSGSTEPAPTKRSIRPGWS